MPGSWTISRERIHVVVSVLGSVVVGRELPTDDQLDERVDVVESCGAQRDVHARRQ